jgi:hypothetical protein
VVLAGHQGIAEDGLSLFFILAPKEFSIRVQACKECQAFRLSSSNCGTRPSSR